jgi:hypothetical protein
MAERVKKGNHTVHAIVAASFPGRKGIMVCSASSLQVIQGWISVGGLWPVAGEEWVYVKAGCRRKLYKRASLDGIVVFMLKFQYVD